MAIVALRVDFYSPSFYAQPRVFGEITKFPFTLFVEVVNCVCYLQYS